jgi:hypothetical protein
VHRLRLIVFARLWRVFLAVALLAVGQSALLHPLEHVDEHGHFVHLVAAPGSDARGENERHDDPDNPSDKLGDTLAALTACAPDAQLAFCASSSSYEAPSYPLDAPRVAEAPPFLSQGPPALL